MAQGLTKEGIKEQISYIYGAAEEQRGKGAAESGKEEKEENLRARIRGKKRIVIKVGSSTITHAETGDADLVLMERLVRLIADLMGRGKEVILVSSGAIAAGRKVMKYTGKPKYIAEKQALAAIGQAKLMMIYQRLFSEYSYTAAQVLLTRNIFLREKSFQNAKNTFEELLRMRVVPIVNENDTVSTNEITFGDNDRLSALVASLTGADLLLLLSDIDGLYTDDPHKNADARLISYVPRISEQLLEMGKPSSGSDVGTGGMRSKIEAAQIAADAGADMLIVRGDDIGAVTEALEGAEIGTIFAAHKDPSFQLMRFIKDEY